MFFRRFSYQLPFTLRHRKSNDKLGNILPLFYGIGLKQQKKGIIFHIFGQKYTVNDYIPSGVSSLKSPSGQGGKVL